MFTRSCMLRVDALGGGGGPKRSLETGLPIGPIVIPFGDYLIEF